MQYKTALVIEAGHDIIHNLSQILTPPEWSIRKVLSNAAAFEFVKATRCDLIVTSEKSSAREDVELLRSIRRLHPHMRMIILTDDGTPKDVVDALREGAFSYFSQPFSLTALAEAERSATQQPSWDDGIEVLSATPSWIRLAARCDMQTADRVVQFIREMIDLPATKRTLWLGRCRNY